MRDLYECLKKRIEPLRKTDKIKTIDLWNNQMEADEDGKQKGIIYNAIFMAFQVGRTRNFSLNIKERVVGVRFYFAIKNYRSNKAIADLDFYQRFSQLIDGFGQGSELPIFSAMREADLEFDEDHELVSLPWIDYQTIYKDFSAYPGMIKGRTTDLTDITVENLTIEDEIT